MVQSLPAPPSPPTSISAVHFHRTAFPPALVAPTSIAHSFHRPPSPSHLHLHRDHSLHLHCTSCTFLVHSTRSLASCLPAHHHLCSTSPSTAPATTTTFFLASVPLSSTRHHHLLGPRLFEIFFRDHLFVYFGALCPCLLSGLFALVFFRGLLPLSRLPCFCRVFARARAVYASVLVHVRRQSDALRASVRPVAFISRVLAVTHSRPALLDMHCAVRLASSASVPV